MTQRKADLPSLDLVLELLAEKVADVLEARQSKRQAPPPKPGPKEKRLLTLAEVIAKVKLSRTSIYELERKGQFPKRKRPTPRTILWDEGEVDAWMDAQQRGMVWEDSTA